MPDKSVRRGRYLISSDRRKLRFDVIQNFLSNSYWAKGRSPEVTRATIRNSCCFGIYHDDRQIGFARVITDYSTFAYLADVFIIEEYRGRGLAKWFMKTVLHHEKFSKVKKWMLATTDAHGLYRKFGFTELEDPSKLMQMTKGQSHHSLSLGIGEP